MDQMQNYECLIVTPPLYSRALAETKSGVADPIAKAIVTAMTGLSTLMREHSVECALCDPDNAYTFAVAEPPAEFLCCIRSDAVPIAGAICEECLRLTDAEKTARVRAWLAQSFPGSREHKPS